MKFASFVVIQQLLHNCCNMVNIIDNIANELMDETIDSVSVIQENETAIFGA